jgi:hypothetical protein
LDWFGAKFTGSRRKTPEFSVRGILSLSSCLPQGRVLRRSGFSLPL